MSNVWCSFSTLVVSTGNDFGLDINRQYVTRLADRENIYVVAGRTREGRRSAFSNYGKGCIYAPGSDIYSLCRAAGIVLKSGTSMAAPHVAALLCTDEASVDWYTAGGLKRVRYNTTVSRR